MSYQETFNDVIDTNLIKLPDTPQVKILNPLKKKIYVNSIQLSFDAYFSDKGVVMIKINGNVVLAKNKVGAYTRLQSFPVNLKEQEFNQQAKIEIFAYNGLDTDFVSLGYTIQISEDPNAQIPTNSLNPLEQRNNAISNFQNLFPLQQRSPNAYSELINMKGYKKLIVLLNKPIIGEQLTLVSNFAPAIGNIGLAIDTLLTNETGVRNNTGSENGAIWDYGTIATRKIVCLFVSHHHPDFGGNQTYKLYTSLDGVDWTLKDTKSLSTQGVPSAQNQTLESDEHSMRFIKMTAIGTGSYTAYLTIREVFNVLDYGGTGSLSFEVKNSNGDWIELISSSEFGTVVNQSASITKQIGDVNTVSTSGKTYGLPSSQTNFRAKYTVANYGLHNSIDIMLVA